MPTSEQILGCSLYQSIHRCIACDTNPLASFPSAAITQVVRHEQAEQLQLVSQSRCLLASPSAVRAMLPGSQAGQVNEMLRQLQWFCVSWVSTFERLLGRECQGAHWEACLLMRMCMGSPSAS